MRGSETRCRVLRRPAASHPVPATGRDAGACAGEASRDGDAPWMDTGPAAPRREPVDVDPPVQVETMFDGPARQPLVVRSRRSAGDVRTELAGPPDATGRRLFGPTRAHFSPETALSLSTVPGHAVLRACFAPFASLPSLALVLAAAPASLVAMPVARPPAQAPADETQRFNGFLNAGIRRGPEVQPADGDHARRARRATTS